MMTFTNLYSFPNTFGSHQMKKNEMGGARRMHG